MEEIEVNGQKMIKPILAGSLLPNNEGMPDLPGYGQYFAIPINAKVELEILSIRKEIIKDIINGESKRSPYSDDKIAVLLNEKGINIARRTVAKYRALEGILAAHQRRLLK